MKSKLVYITRQIPEIGVNLLKDQGYKVDVFKKDRPITEKELLSALSKKKYDGIISLLTDHINKEVLDVCPNVKVVANYAVGYNNIDVEEAKKRKIIVTNTRGTSAHAVAEFTVALIGTVTTRIAEADEWTRKGKWKGWNPNLFMGKDIFGKTVGLVGSGAIGSIVAEILHKGFKCKIIYSDIKRNSVIESICDARHLSLEEVLKNADIVSLHTPLLPSTKHLINKKSFSLMKNGVVFINTSRGPVVDEEALVDALKSGKIYGAGLDVFESEPHINHGLLKMKNVVVTPHIASARESARNEMSILACKNIISVLEDGKALTEV